MMTATLRAVGSAARQLKGRLLATLKGRPTHELHSLQDRV